MDIKVNRGVLRFVKMNHITEKKLNVNKEAPQSFSSKYKREKKAKKNVVAQKAASTVNVPFFKSE